MKKIIGFALLAGLVLSAQVQAEKIEVPLRDYAVIAGGGVSRVLVSTPLTGLPNGAKVVFAEVDIPAFLPRNYQGILSLIAHPVARTWDKNTVTWTSPWAKPGGDFDTTQCTRFFLGKKEDAPTKLDVTRFVRAWAEQGRSNYGLILLRPRSEGHGFRAEISGLREQLSQVVLKVTYRR
jgi:hypothetical protein